MPADTVLSAALADAARRAFTQVRAAHPAEEFYCFALFTSAEASYIEPACSGEQGLHQAAQDYVHAHGGALATRLAELRWSPADSPYHLFGDEHFAQVQRLLGARPDPDELDDDAAEAEVHARLEACFAALAQLDGDGFFGRGAQRDRVLVTVLQGDQSDRSRLRNARRLNPSTAVERLVADLQIPEPVGSFTTLGSRAVYQVAALAYAPAGSVLAACSSDGEVFAWDLLGGRELLAIWRDGDCWAVALSADGRLLLVDDGAEVVRIDLASGEQKVLTRLADEVCGLGVSPDGTTLVAGGWDGTVRAVDTRTGQQRWRVASLAKCLRFAPDGQLLALAGDGVMLVDPADGSVRRRLLRGAQPGTFQRLAWSPEARTVAIGNQGPAGGRLSVWRWQGAGQARRPLQRPGAGDQQLGDVCDLAFSPSGALLASAHAGGDIHVWDAESGQHRLRLRGRQESMLAVVFIDERHLAAAGRDVDCGPPVYIFDL